MVTVSAAAVEASVCIDAVGERATSGVVCCTFVDICAINIVKKVNAYDRFCSLLVNLLSNGSLFSSFCPSICPSIHLLAFCLAMLC